MVIFAVTGHRPDKLRSAREAPDGYDRNNPVRRHLRARFRSLLVALAADAWCYGEGCEVITGGALGFDQDCAGVALRVGVPYAVYVPFPGQESRWPAEAQEVYQQVLQRAARVVLCHTEPPRDDGHAGRLLLERNLRMLADARLVVAAWDGSNGGTSHCVRAARARDMLVVNLMQDLQRARADWERETARARDGVTCV